MKDSPEQQARQNSFFLMLLLLLGFFSWLALLGNHRENWERSCTAQGGEIVKFSRSTECMKDGKPIRYSHV